MEFVLVHYHSLPRGGHATSYKTTTKVLECGFFLPSAEKLISF